MKGMLNQRQWLTYTALITGSFLLIADPVKAATIIEVPFTWTLQQEGSSSVLTSISNFGGPGFSNSDGAVQEGNFTINFIHNPPADYIRLDPLPTQVTLSLEVIFSGVLQNTTLGGVASANGSFNYNFQDIGEEFFFLPEELRDVVIPGEINSRGFLQEQNFTFAATQGNINYSKYVGVQTLFGFNSVGECPTFACDFVAAVAEMSVSGELLNPVIQIRYAVPDVPEPVPEPLPIWGLGTATGLSILFKKELSKKNKKKS